MPALAGQQEHQDAGKEAGVNHSVTINAQVESRTLTTNRTRSMAIVPLPLSLDVEARALLHHVLEHGDIVGRDSAGRTVIQLLVDDWTLEKLMGFDVEAAELEEGGDAESEPDNEEDGPPVLLLDLVRPKTVGRRRGLGPGVRSSRLSYGP